MAEAGKFHLSLFEWTTPERLFVRLKSIFGDEDLAFNELSIAYYTNVKSARVPRGDFGHLLWEEAEINAPEFCRVRPLRLISPNCRVWTEEEIDEWAENRPVARKTARQESTPLEPDSPVLSTPGRRRCVAASERPPPESRPA